MATEEHDDMDGPGHATGSLVGPRRIFAGGLSNALGPGASAEMLAEALGNRLENLPGLKLLVKRTETVAGIPAARVEVVAPGTGDPGRQWARQADRDSPAKP